MRRTNHRKIVPLRRPRKPLLPWRWRRRGAWAMAEAGGAVAWFLIFAVLAGGYAIVAPHLDDWRSDRRAMRDDCSVLRVIDGDTIDLACPGLGTLRTRIVGYDAPERFSPQCVEEKTAADAASAALGRWVRQGGRVEVALEGVDRYGRELADMRLGGERVARVMVAQGHGRRYLGHARGGWCGWADNRDLRIP